MISNFLSDKRCRRPGSRDGAFTLTELLTVIAIIGILVVIMIPVVSGVRRSAGAAKCQGNFKHIGQALHLYLAENKNTLPDIRYQVAEGSVVLAPYMSMKMNNNTNTLVWVQKNFSCPSRDTGAVWGAGFNVFVANTRFSLYSRPSSQPYAMDLCEDARYIDGTSLSSSSKRLAMAIPKPHSGKVTVLYLDGHVALKKVSELSRADITRDTESYSAAQELGADGSGGIGRPENDI